MKVIVIGAGAAGLSIAWRLQQAGATVTVIDRAQPGRGATWAAAGMIAVAGEVGGSDDAEASLSHQASALWPAFAHELEQASGIGVGYRRSGAIFVALAGEDQSWLPAGALVREISGDEARRREPMLTGQFSKVLFAEGEAQADNRTLGLALARAFVRSGGSLIANESVLRLALKGDRVTEAVTSFGHYDGDAFVLAAGAWSGVLEGLPPEALPPVRPVKGEMIAFEAGSALSQIVRGAGVYLVPRGARIAAGATVEDAGFDTSLTAAARDELRSRAVELVPALGEARIVDHWAGLRPGTPDGLPILGQTAARGLYAATGQYRNGILFAPAIAELLCRLVLGRAETPPAFDPLRFGSSGLPGAGRGRA